MNTKALLKIIPFLLILASCSYDPSQTGPEIETSGRKVRTKTTIGPSGSVFVYLHPDEPELKLPASLSVTFENPTLNEPNLEIKRIGALDRRFVNTTSTELYSFGCDGQASVEIPSTIDADSVEFCGPIHIPPRDFKVRANQIIMKNSFFSMNQRAPQEFRPELTTSSVEFHANKIILVGSNQITATGASSEQRREIPPNIHLRIVSYEGPGNLEIYSQKSFRTWEY